MSEPQAASTNDRPPAVASEPRRPVLDWLLARRELAQARQADAAITAHNRASLKRAGLAFELASDELVQSESGLALALELFRESVYWALCAGDSSLERATPEAAWLASENSQLATLNLQPAEVADAGAALGSTFVELAERPVEQQQSSLKLLKRVAEQLIKQGRRRDGQLGRAQLLRVARFLLIIAPVCLVVLALALRQPPNLAEGAPWRTSSTEFECHPERSECGNAATKILFHTKQEASPWFRYDFGKPLDFSSVTIRNRSDYGPELAVPLVVEVSDDDHHYREIARRDEVFTTWHTTFAKQHARYLRVRALNKTYLHLEGVEVHP